MPIVFTQTGAPSNASAADGSNLPVLGGKAGEAIVAELHGKYYTATYRGRTFMTQGASAGVTIPVSTSTVPTFTVYNPIGSGIIMELGKLNIGINNATTVVSSIHWGIISGLTVAPTGLTALAVGSGNVGGAGVNLGQIYSAATLAAAATKFFDLFSVSATSGAFPNFNYDHEGSLILQPGSLVHLCGTAAQSQAALVSMTWSEWPL